MIGLEVEGDLAYHARGGISDYATLCGLDGTDTTVSEQLDRPVPPDAKIDCPQCKAIFVSAKALRMSDFEA